MNDAFAFLKLLNENFPIENLYEFSRIEGYFSALCKNTETATETDRRRRQREDYPNVKRIGTVFYMSHIICRIVEGAIVLNG